MSSTVQNGVPNPPGPNPSEQGTVKRLTLGSLSKLAQTGETFACLTCYDATTARHLTRAGVHVLLVGDTAAEMVLGFSRTIDMDLDVLIALTAGVKRGSVSACGAGAIVMADMPFMSYHAGEDEAVKNAGRFLTQGLADIVKLEADATHANLIARMVRAGIPICGHVGSKPQRVAMTGGYAAAGRTREDAAAVVADAVALEQAGCSMLLVEAVPEEVTASIIEKTRVPLIGIGAGPACHGQVLVLQDLLGLSDRPPAFAKPMADLGTALQKAGRDWVKLVKQRGVERSPYSMKVGSIKPGQE